MRNSYNYWSIGAGVRTLVSAKIGHREQIGRKGFEYGVGITPIIYVTEIYAFGSYFYYPTPSPKSQQYFGLGLKAGGFLEMKQCKFGYIAPGVILGKEYLSNKGNRRFFQVAMGMGALTILLRKPLLGVWLLSFKNFKNRHLDCLYSNHQEPSLFQIGITEELLAKVIYLIGH